MPVCIDNCHRVSQYPSCIPVSGDPIARSPYADLVPGTSFAAGDAETSVLPPKLTRYAALANLFMKYGSRISAGTAAGPTASDPSAADETDAARKFAADLEKLGPTFVKLGQLLSTRADLLPPVYLEALSRLQDKVEPVSVADVYQTIEEDLQVKVSKAFSWFDTEPLASASLGQVHRGTLRDGRAVVIKVQRPHINEQVKHDLAALDEIAALADQHTQAGRRYDFAPMVREFRKALMVELDYKQEASHLRTLGRNLAEFERIVVPAPIDGFISTRVLTMNYITGTKVTAMNPVTLVDIEP